MEIVRSLQKPLLPERIFRPVRAAAARYCSALWEFCAGPAERGRPYSPPAIGSARTAAINSKHDTAGSALDRFNGIMPEVLRLPSDGRTQLLPGQLPVPFMRTLHGNCNRSCRCVPDGVFLHFPIFHCPSWDPAGS